LVSLHLRLLPFLVVALSAGPLACRAREPPEAARARVTKAFLEAQVAGLQGLIGKAERGELVTADQIAVGVEEGVARELLNAPLPQEQVIAGRLRVRIEAAEPYFRGSQGAMGFRARVTSEDLPGAFAELELGGTLGDMTLVGGRLSARVRLFHFSIIRASVGPLAQAALESVVRENLDAIQEQIPPLEVPVHIDEKISIDSFDAGPVSARGGELPLRAKVSHVLYAHQRLWVLIDAKVGPWAKKAGP
jgi:hypothetical protein